MKERKKACFRCASSNESSFWGKKCWNHGALSLSMLLPTLLSNIFIQGILSYCFCILFFDFSLCACFTFDFNISRFFCIFSYLCISSLLDGNLGMHVWVCTKFVLLSWDFNLLNIFRTFLQRWNFKKWKKRKEKKWLIINICILISRIKICNIGRYTIYVTYINYQSS